MADDKLKLILASASPRRKELLGHLQIPFSIKISHASEESLAHDPVIFCQEIATTKAKAIFDQVPGLHMVVAADTIVCLNQKIYGKPRDRVEAGQFLMELSGKTHSVFTGVCLKLKIEDQTLERAFVEESRVTFNQLNPELLERYLKTGDSLDKAGAYGIQGPSLTFISKVEGDYANVVGFPLSRFVLECDAFLKPLSGEKSWFDLF